MYANQYDTAGPRAWIVLNESNPMPLMCRPPLCRRALLPIGRYRTQRKPMAHNGAGNLGAGRLCMGSVGAGTPTV